MGDVSSSNFFRAVPEPSYKIYFNVFFHHSKSPILAVLIPKMTGFVNEVMTFFHLWKAVFISRNPIKNFEECIQVLWLQPVESSSLAFPLLFKAFFSCICLIEKRSLAKKKLFSLSSEEETRNNLIRNAGKCQPNWKLFHKKRGYIV